MRKSKNPFRGGQGQKVVLLAFKKWFVPLKKTAKQGANNHGLW